MVKFLQILKEQTEQTQKKFKIVAKKLNSKWPLISRWLPKLNQILATILN
jgi:hypothetical protein